MRLIDSMCIILMMIVTLGARAEEPVFIEVDEPLEGRREIRLEEQWRVGEDEEDVLLGRIVDAERDSEGNLYLLDEQLCQVHVFGENGEYQTSLSRQGEGPGEVRNPADLLLMPDGNIGILQRMPGKIELINGEGIPAGSIIPSREDDGTSIPMMFREAAIYGDGLIIVGSTFRGRGGTMNPRQYLSIVDMNGVEQIRILEKERVIDRSNPRYEEEKVDFVDNGRWAVGDSGFIYAAPDRSAYRIEVYSENASLLKIIERIGYEPRTRTSEDKEAIAGKIAFMRRGRRRQVEAVLSDYDSAIQRLHVMPDGRLWVFHSLSLYRDTDGIFCTVDEFDEDGRYTSSIDIACDGDPRSDRLIVIDDSRFILVRGFENIAFPGDEEESDSGEWKPLIVSYLIAASDVG